MFLEHFRGERMPGEIKGVDSDTVYDLLAKDRRRRVLRHLRDVEDEAVHLEDLAETVAAAEADASPDPDHLTAVRTSLYHAHLPKLADAGVIQFSRNPGRVSLGERADAVLSLLEDISTAD